VFNGLSNGSSSSPSSSSPTSSVTTPFLRLPYALISPDCYSHSDGVNRLALPRHELVLQYTPGRPSSPSNPSTKLVRGKFIRSYRWGFLDVLDPNHSDFLALRKAVFHHMQVSATLNWRRSSECDTMSLDVAEIYTRIFV
jgi:hypothetical protein